MSRSAKHLAPKEPRSRADASEREVRRPAPERRGLPRGVKIVIIVVAILLVLVLAAYLVFSHFYGKMNYTEAMTESERADAIAAYTVGQAQLPAEPEEPEEIPEDAEVIPEEKVQDIQDVIQEQLAASGGSLISDKDIINILLIGTDARNMNEKARSDVMLLVSVNQRTKKIILTSFMRDIYTYIPGYGYNRLNTPNSIAGPDYLIETLEYDFGIDINNYAMVNFYAFADVIDTLGGIDLALTDREVDFINGQAYYGEQANLGVGTGAVYLDYSSDGWYHLNGTQALAHCRNRSSAGSDFDRTSRQRTVINTLLERAKSVPLSELYTLANVVLPMVTTDLTQGDCLSLLLKSGDYLTYDIVQYRVPGDNYDLAMISGMSVIQINFETSAANLQDFIYS